ncbi:MAG: hypothetical protein OXF85_00415 [Candidatus Saccharibacteria bacterium]|nr:hypothetical protein [Candidatus Saccharibacteria bacterium]
MLVSKGIIQELEKFFQDYVTKHFYTDSRTVGYQISRHLVKYVHVDKYPYDHHYKPLLSEEELSNWQNAIVKACQISDKDFPEGWEQYSYPVVENIPYYNQLKPNYNQLSIDDLCDAWALKYTNIIHIRTQTELSKLPEKEMNSLKIQRQLTTKIIKEYHFSQYANRLLDLIYEEFSLTRNIKFPSSWAEADAPQILLPNFQLPLPGVGYKDLEKSSQGSLPLNAQLMGFYEQEYGHDINSKQILRKAREQGKTEILRGFRTKIQVRAFLTLLVLLKQALNANRCENIGTLIIGFTCSRKDLYYIAQVVSANNKGDAQDIIHQIQELQDIPYAIQVGGKPYVNPVVQGFQENDDQTYTIALNVQFCMNTAEGYQEMSWLGLSKIRKFNLNTHKLFFFILNQLTNRGRISRKDINQGIIKQTYAFSDFYSKVDVSGFQYPNKKNKAIKGYLQNLERVGLIRNLICSHKNLSYEIPIENWGLGVDRFTKRLSSPSKV